MSLKLFTLFLLYSVWICMQRKSTCTPKDMYWESSDQNRTGLNWMMLKEASTSFPALIWSKVFWKEVKIFKNFYVQYGCFNDVIGFHLQSVAEAWRISVRHSKFSSCFVEYYIDLYSKWGRSWWVVVEVDLSVKQRANLFRLSAERTKRSADLSWLSCAMTSSVH